jgi:hypothetical protein
MGGVEEPLHHPRRHHPGPRLSSAALRAQDTVDRAYRRALQLLIAALVGGLLVWLAATWVRGRRALAR